LISCSVVSPFFTASNAASRRKRVPARCERGDCLFHLATDIDG